MKIEEFDRLSVGMDIPENRKHDWGWLLRNLFIRNANHENFVEVYKIVKENYKEWIKA